MNSRILPIVAILFAVAIVFLYIRPVWTGPIKEAKAAIALNKDALAAAKDYAAKQQELSEKKGTISEENLQRLRTFLPDSVDNVGLILDLNALAARSGVSLTDIDVIADSNTDSETGGLHRNPVGSVNLTFSALGTYAALQTFLERVETSARLLDVQSVSIRGSETGVYTLQMSIRLYWLR